MRDRAETEKMPRERDPEAERDDGSAEGKLAIRGGLYSCRKSTQIITKASAEPPRVISRGFISNVL